MKKVTACTILTTAEGVRLSIVFSEINESGIITKDNCRINRILVDADALTNAENLINFAQSCIDTE